MLARCSSACTCFCFCVGVLAGFCTVRLCVGAASLCVSPVLVCYGGLCACLCLCLANLSSPENKLQPRSPAMQSSECRRPGGKLPPKGQRVCSNKGSCKTGFESSMLQRKLCLRKWVVRLPVLNYGHIMTGKRMICFFVPCGPSLLGLDPHEDLHRQNAPGPLIQRTCSLDSHGCGSKMRTQDGTLVNTKTCGPLVVLF